MIITKSVHDEILRKVKQAPPETGGALGMTEGVITHFVFDKGVGENPCCYEPDVKRLNSVIKAWQEKGVLFCGIVHSHIPLQNELSDDDEIYIKSILESMKGCCEFLYFPVVTDGCVTSYCARLVSGELVIEKEEVLVKS